MTQDSSNRAKIATRVIEIFEFFDDAHPHATVMDIVRRYERPQSSTSELLRHMVDLGLLRRDRISRAYSPTPRVAMLTRAAQPEIVRNGELTRLIDRLTEQTGLNVAIFGMVGLNVQIYSWRSGHRIQAGSCLTDVHGGQQDGIMGSAAGRLLLSTIPQPRRDGMLRRLNAEAESKFVFGDVSAQVQSYVRTGAASGDFGFGTDAETAAVLLPGLPMDQPLAIGFVYDASSGFDADTLIENLRKSVARCVAEPEEVAGRISPLFNTGRSAATFVGQ